MASSIDDRIESYPDDNSCSGNSPLLGRRPLSCYSDRESSQHLGSSSRDFPYEPVHAVDKTKVYTRRWYVLFVFSLMGLLNSLIWNTWGPISNSASNVFDWSDAEIATFANLGNIVYCFTVFAGSWIMDVLGMLDLILASVL